MMMLIVYSTVNIQEKASQDAFPYLEEAYEDKRIMKRKKIRGAGGGVGGWGWRTSTELCHENINDEKSVSKYTEDLPQHHTDIFGQHYLFPKLKLNKLTTQPV